MLGGLVPCVSPGLPPSATCRSVLGDRGPQIKAVA
jgi:hypothetical protein